MLIAKDSHPIVIIGGGVIGSAIAYFLTLEQPGCEVVVVERDPTYARASSALSASSIRQQFSTDINIQISAFGIGFLRNVGTLLACHGDVPDIGLHEGGYLYLATLAGETTLRENHALQKQHGADVALLSPQHLAERFPWLALQDVVLGSLGLSGEGWFDGYLLLKALRKKAQSQGVRYVADEAVGLDTAASDGVLHVNAVRLQSRTVLPCRYAVNAGGPWAAAIAGWSTPASSSSTPRTSRSTSSGDSLGSPRSSMICCVGGPRCASTWARPPSPPERCWLTSGPSSAQRRPGPCAIAASTSATDATPDSTSE